MRSNYCIIDGTALNCRVSTNFNFVTDDEPSRMPQGKRYPILVAGTIQPFKAENRSSIDDASLSNHAAATNNSMVPDDGSRANMRTTFDNCILTYGAAFTNVHFGSDDCGLCDVRGGPLMEKSFHRARKRQPGVRNRNPRAPTTYINRERQRHKKHCPNILDMPA